MKVETGVARIKRTLDQMVRSLGHSDVRSPSRSRERVQPKITREGLANLKIQGKYMGFMRQLTSAQKDQVRRVKEKRGLKRAAERAEELVRKWH